MYYASTSLLTGIPAAAASLGCLISEEGSASHVALAVAECPKCGGEMREGEALVHVSTSVGSQISSGFGMTGIPGMGIPSGETTSEERLLWRESTGRKTGWLVKSEEQKTMKISGRRCTACGYIELHTQE